MPGSRVRVPPLLLAGQQLGSHTSRIATVTEPSTELRSSNGNEKGPDILRALVCFPSPNVIPLDQPEVSLRVARFPAAPTGPTPTVANALDQQPRALHLHDRPRQFDPRFLMKISVLLPNNLTRTLTLTTTLTTGDGAGHAVV